MPLPGRTAEKCCVEDGDALAEVNAAVLRLLERHYPAAQYATVAVHLRDGVPDVILPVPGTPADPH